MGLRLDETRVVQVDWPDGAADVDRPEDYERLVATGRLAAPPDEGES